MWKAACEIRETNNEEVTWSSWRWSMMAVGWLEMAKSIVVANKTCTWHAMLQHVHALTRLVNTSHDGRTVVDQSAAEVHAPWTKLKFTSSQAKHAVWSVTKWSIVKDTSASFLVEQEFTTTTQSSLCRSHPSPQTELDDGPDRRHDMQPSLQFQACIHRLWSLDVDMWPFDRRSS